MRPIFNMTLFVAPLVILIACKTTEKNRTDNYAPDSVTCVTDTDPKCVGAASAMVQIPLGDGEENSSIDKNSVSGLCEMMIEGEQELRPCNDIKLVLRSTRENEVREAVIDGYNFHITDLSQNNYNLEASSPKYEIFTDKKQLAPGHKVKIRVRAKPKN